MDALEFHNHFMKKNSYDNIVIKLGEMSPRERFFRIMEFQKPDRIIDTEFGYWAGTLRRWHQEGLPSYVDSNEKADIYFGFDNWKKTLPVNVLINPFLDERVISDDGHHKIIIDGEGVECEVFSDGSDSIPHYLDFPIKDQKSYYKNLKDKLKPDPEGRIEIDLAKMSVKLENRNYILESQGGSTAGKIRNWMGFENICFALYDQPELLQEILSDLQAVSTAVAEKLMKYITVDLIAWWEDIAYKNGPIVTPDWFIKSCGPVYKAIMDIYRNNGTKYSYVDCDGDFQKLLPAWFNNGVNIMFPLEVAAGIHPWKLRKENPGIRMMGGVDKTVLLSSKDDIKKELLKLKPLVEEGGFIPHIDHRVQADVSYENYLYYLQAKREIFELPGS